MTLKEFQPGVFAREGEIQDHPEGQLIFEDGRWRWVNKRKRKEIPPEFRYRKGEDTTRFRRKLMMPNVPETKF